MKKIKVGTAQINNGFAGQYYLPYSIGVLHAYFMHNSKKYESYLNKANELDKFSGNRYLQNKVVLEVGIDRFIEMAEKAYNNNTLFYGIATDMFLFEYRDHPKFVAFVEKIRKGK